MCFRDDIENDRREERSRDNGGDDIVHRAIVHMDRLMFFEERHMQIHRGQIDQGPWDAVVAEAARTRRFSVEKHRLE